MRLIEALGGLGAILLGAAVFVLTLSFPALPEGYPGPALFPNLVASLLVLFGGILAWQGVRPGGRAGCPNATAAPTAAGGAAQPLAAGSAAAWVNALLVIAAVIAYVHLVGRLGFPVTVGLLNLGLMIRLGTPWSAALPVAAATAIGVYLLFARLLLVPLPPGPFG